MVDFNEQIGAWLSFVRRTYASGTFSQYRCVIHQLQRYIEQNNKDFESCSDIESFLDYKVENGGSRKMFNSYLICIRNFYAWRRKRMQIPSPVHTIEFIREDPPTQRCLSDDEIAKLLAHTDGMDKDIILFLANSGIRRAELQDLKWGDISKDERFFVVASGKGRKKRTIPINDTIREVLHKYSRLSDDEPLQIAQIYYGHEGASWMIRRVASKCGVKRAGCHAIRHYFATKMIKKNINLYKLSKILGHSSPETTSKLYLHLAPCDLFGLTDCLLD